MEAVTDIFNLSNFTELSKPTSDSHDNLYPETDLLPHFTGVTLVVLAVMMATAAALIIFGNALVFLAFVVDARLRTQTNLYLLSLALCDFSVGVVSIPFYIPYGLHGTWMLGKELCKLWLLIDYTACAVSVFNIVLISYDRYLSVTKPVAYRARQEKMCNATSKIIIVWLLAFIIYGPALLSWDIITGQTQVPNGQCFAEFEYSSYFSVCFLTCIFFIPFCSVSYFNIGIYWNINKRNKNKQINKKMQLESKSEDTKIFLSIIKLCKLSLKEKLPCFFHVSEESSSSGSSGLPFSVTKPDKTRGELNNQNMLSTVDEQKTPSQNSALRLSKDKKIAKSLALLWSGASAFILPIVVTTVSLMIVIGNALVFVAFLVEASLRTQSNLFLINLAVCDFSVGAISIPLYIPYGLYGIWILGKELCTFWLVMDYTACAASVFTIVLISYDRYLSVTKAVAYRSEQEKTVKGIAKIGVIWVLAFLVYGPALIFWNFVTGETNVPEGQCYAEFDSSWYFLICFFIFNFIIPFCSVSYFNLSIYFNIRKRSQNIQITLSTKKQITAKILALTTWLFFKKNPKSSLPEKVPCSLSVSQESAVLRNVGQGSQEVKRNQSNSAVKDQKPLPQNIAHRLSKDRKIAKSLAILVCIFGACWAPYILFTTVNSIRPDANGYFWTYITTWCVWLNSLINPVLYPLCHRSFRRTFLKILCYK
ncbi:histamine H3 receptor-like [Protopterus annectens]|uniref:histamine H3 receptor-like n=1 Tax=Protopterus annectens TaxID=7888 RepID=UPI001CF9CAA4|nr:histamine H3 receptor-like [Protopterus annectens]